MLLVVLNTVKVCRTKNVSNSSKDSFLSSWQNLKNFP